MPLKKMLNALTGQKEQSLQKADEPTTSVTQLSDLFPAYRPAEIDINKYKKLPLTGLAAMGTAFSQMPEGARNIVQTVTHELASKGKLFIGCDPNNIKGILKYNEFGTTGAIFKDQPGSPVIAGNMRFKPLEGGLPVNTRTSTTIPFDPTTMVIAAALMNIEQKLADLQKLAEEILQFLKLDKQSKQRGNLNALGEILEDYKRHPNSEDFLRLRGIEVQAIKREAQQDMLFYQERIAKELKEQKLIHLAAQAQGMLDAIMSEFYEYQLACYLYSFSSYLDIMLQQNFDAAMLETTARRMKEHAERYSELYLQCRMQIENYHQASIDVQIKGGLGNLAKNLGNAIASVPVLREGQEMLINAGQSLSDGNEATRQKKLAQFSPLEDSRMGSFIENIHTVNLMYNEPKAMLTDGESLFIMVADQ